LWSLGQQRCISTIEIHTGGVWTLCANESFSKVYSGGKDCKVYATDFTNIEESLLICEETAPVLSVSLIFVKRNLIFFINSDFYLLQKYYIRLTLDTTKKVYGLQQLIPQLKIGV